MTRKLLSAAAVMAAVFFTGSIAAQAADVTFGGQLRPRYEIWNESTAGVHHQFLDMRVRLNTKVKIDENTSAFIQLQANQRFGSFADGKRSTASFPTDGNDTTADVGIHQAYFTIKNLFGLPVSVRPGRQEIVLDGHRLFGHTGWTMGAQSHDAVRFTHAHDKMTVSYYYSITQEDSSKGIAGQNFGGTDVDSNLDNNEVHILWVNMKGLVGAGSSTSGYFVFSDNDSTGVSGDFYTIGGRHAGSAGAISYRGEVYIQTGKSVAGTSGDKEAFMVGGRVGYKMANVAMKPKITLWLDYLSGNDIGSTDDERFDVLFDTGHKFYGLMDKFAGVGNPSAGLIDLAVKVAFQPMAKLTVKADFHHFTHAEDRVSGFTGVTSDEIGQEIDLTFKYKYSASTGISVGYSHFIADDDFATDDSDWLYAMFDVKF